MNDITHTIDALMILKQEYCYIISINLTTYRFIDMINPSELSDIRDWASNLMSSDNIYDINLDEKMTLEKIKHHFSKSNDKLSFRIRKKTSNNMITWFSIQIYKSHNYSSKHENIILLVRNIEEEYKDIIDKQIELEELSYKDNLTDIGNRRALDKFMERNRTQIGVMYIDLNGLKETNDILGHEFGDHLIQSCSDLLVKHFRKNECYRIGGDEFVVATENIDENIFMRKIRLFKEDAFSKNISISIGVAWSYCNNIDCLVSAAEKRMRYNKNEFYKTHKKYR